MQNRAKQGHRHGKTGTAAQQEISAGKRAGRREAKLRTEQELVSERTGDELLLRQVARRTVLAFPPSASKVKRACKFPCLPESFLRVSACLGKQSLRQRQDQSFSKREIISSAATAHSKPLLPAFEPARSSACSSVSQVRTPKSTGRPLSRPTAASPLETSLQT